MARTSKVTKERVFQAARELFQAGEKVTFGRVYAKLDNQGSGRVINDFIRDWRVEMGDQLALASERSLPGVPDSVVQQIDNMVTSCWQLSLSAAEDAFQGARDRLDAERQEIEANLSIAHEQTAAVESENLSLAGEIKALRVELEGKSEAHQDALRRFGEASVSLAERSEQLASSREDLARALTTIDSDRAAHETKLAQIREHHAAELAAERQRGEDQLAAAQAKHQAELEREQTIHEGERRHLMMITDELRTSAKQAADGWKAQLESWKAQLGSSKTMLDELRIRASTAEAEAARWHGRSELLTEQVASERARADAAEQQLKAQPTPEITPSPGGDKHTRTVK